MAQLLPIYHPISQVCLGVKPRHTVHRRGYWHKAVKSLLLVRDEGGKFRVVVQQRSGLVDIEKYTFDQSCNVHQHQGEDNLIDVFYRGLDDELGIKPSAVKQLHVPSGEFDCRHCKIYPKQKEIFNNELVSFVVAVIDEAGYARSRRVKGHCLMGLKEYRQTVLAKYREFTRTARYYVANPVYWKYVRQVARNYGKSWQKKQYTIHQKSREAYYSFYGYDVYIRWDKDASFYQIMKLGREYTPVFSGKVKGELSCFKSREGEIVLVSNNQIINYLTDIQV